LARLFTISFGDCFGCGCLVVAEEWNATTKRRLGMFSLLLACAAGYVFGIILCVLLIFAFFGWLCTPNGEPNNDTGAYTAPDGTVFEVPK